MTIAYPEAPVRAAPMALGVAAVGGYVGLLSWSMEHTTYDVWGALISVPVLVLVSVPLLRRAIRIEADRWFTQVLILAFALKLAGGLARYFVVSSAYGGADASAYNSTGQRLSQLWLHGQFSFDTNSKFVGTGFIRLVTAAVYTVSGPSQISGFLVFSWIGFWGLYFSYRAFRTAFPDADHRRYAVLVFFLPSLLFWPSSIGKEAWMMLSVGLIALGAANIYAHQRRGYPLLLVGLTAGAMVRPHVVVFAVAGVLVAYILAPRRQPGPGSAFWKAVGVLALSVTAVVFLHRAQGFLGLTSLSSEQLDAVRNTAAGHTVEGGSMFTATPVHSPLDFPKGLVTVLFRPFPWEAHNAQAMVSSLESVLLLILLATSWRRWARLPRMLTKRPYATLCIVYIALFVYAFSIFGNFGILVRERVQVLPFVLALAALPLASPHRPVGVDAADSLARKVRT